MASADKDPLKSSLSLQEDTIDKGATQSKAKEKDTKKKQTKKKKDVVDSWEDDYESSSSAQDAQQPAPTAKATSKSPPTPPNSHPEPTISRSPDLDARRPEKTDAVARRMISAGLGLKMPKPTAEQISYQKSIREQERKRRDQQREEEKRLKEEAEKAKAAIWND
ncbi:hypothetical protein L249_8082 [Ophiocordyceps polyrhachis-furcata BCC 54312]|uniref:Casein kinase substrate phosphoprotein PP28 domain-containing protein n=1 Tax=Ophiocordyceps polyrhachis-furcata BCC 54312 TaxID=1330021 RepID=A0A367LH46_9HYPO|nr:hypothetical protein L249_8082 [Ophiocordyceps polyrhachis-furcata BCC 54312]